MGCGAHWVRALRSYLALGSSCPLPFLSLLFLPCPLLFLLFPSLPSLLHPLSCSSPNPCETRANLTALLRVLICHRNKIVTNRTEEVCFQVLHRELQSSLSFLPGEGSQGPAECCEGQDSTVILADSGSRGGCSRVLRYMQLAAAYREKEAIQRGAGVVHRSALEPHVTWVEMHRPCENSHQTAMWHSWRCSVWTECKCWLMTLERQVLRTRGAPRNLSS